MFDTYETPVVAQQMTLGCRVLDALEPYQIKGTKTFNVRAMLLEEEI